MNFLKGYRTYIVGAGMLCAAAIKFIDSGGDFHQLFQTDFLVLIGAALAAIFGRSALDDVAKGIESVNSMLGSGKVKG